MDMSINGHTDQANVRVARVWYSGTDAILEGEAVCYDVANGTATAENGKRHNQVTRPTTSNNMAFAGVAVNNHADP